MKKFSLYRIAAYLFGLSIVALGITFLIRANLGTGAWDALIVALSRITGFTVGTWIILIGVILLIVNATILRKIPDFPALITVIILGSLVDFWLNSTSIPTLSFMMSFALFSLGLLITAFGVAVYTQAQFAITPIDRLMFVIQRKTGYSLRVSRFISEGAALVLAFLFKGPIGVGTIIVTILLGPLIQFFVQFIQSFSKQTDI